MRIRWWLVIATVALASGCTIQVNQPQPSPTASRTSPAAGVTLTGQEVAGHPFGSFVGEVEPALRAGLGEPTDVTENTGCPLDPAWTRTMRWQGLSVVFEGDTQRRTDQTALTDWQVRIDQGVPSGVVLGDDVSPTASFAELVADHPGASVTQRLGWHVLELPGGITYLSENSTTPTVIWGGPVQWCE